MRLRLGALILIAGCLLAPLPSAAQTMGETKLQLNEQTIKAGLVYNFLKYTTWPPDSSPLKTGRLTVCLMGVTPADSYLTPLQGQTAQQAGISLIRKDNINATDDCSMLFFDAAQKSKIPAMLAAIKGKPILTVSDTDDFARMGGMVELAMLDKRVAIFIDKQAVDGAGLTIQSRLLNLAKKVSE